MVECGFVAKFHKQYKLLSNTDDTIKHIHWTSVNIAQLGYSIATVGLCYGISVCSLFVEYMFHYSRK